MADEDKGKAGGASGKDRGLRSARQHIQDAIEQAAEEHKRRLRTHRIELARRGVAAYEQRKITEAVRSFHTYLRVLEEIKGCAEGGLSPALFDNKKELPELLLISGVYWDLTKIYDRTRTPAKYREFTHYMEKFILFSRDMPYGPLSAETLRKYIGNEKPVHREDFKNAYKILGGGRCFVATELADEIAPTTMPRLWALRDQVLARSAAGRAFVAWYYRNGPALARVAARLPRPTRRALARALDLVAAASPPLTDEASRPSGP
jgi:hypothetical protein